MKLKFLSPPPSPPAIRTAMAKAFERERMGLPVYDFSSGNVGRLLYKVELFSKLDLEVIDDLPQSNELIAKSLAEGLRNSLTPNPVGLAYSPTGGTSSIKRQVIRYFREFHGLSLSDEDLNNVIVTAGGQQAMMASIRSLRPGSTLICCRWEYSAIPGIADDRGLKLVRVAVNEDLSIDLNDLREKACSESVLYISMPNNPTGYVSPRDFEKAVEIMAENEGGVIWDAPYIFTILRLGRRASFEKEFLVRVINEFKKPAQKHFDRMCILSSLSKTCLVAGLRFGFAAAPEEWIENMNAIIGRENLSSPTISFMIGENLLKSFLENPITHEWMCKVLAERLNTLMEELNDYLILPKNGMFGGLYALIKTPVDGSKFAEKLVDEYGIVTVPGKPFYGEEVNAVRLSLVSVPWEEGEKTWIDSVKALKNALERAR